MFTVAVTPVFVRYAQAIWTEAEIHELIGWIAANPDVGDLITGSGGCRKVRWSVSGRGKRGGARVIYCVRGEVIWLLIAYKKSDLDRLPTELLAQLKEGLQDAH